MNIGTLKNKDVVLLGTKCGKFGKTIHISEGYVEVDVVLDNGERYIIESDGKLSVLSLDDTVRLVESMSDDSYAESSIYSYIILHNYSGRLDLNIYDSEDKAYKLPPLIKSNKSALLNRCPDYSHIQVNISDTKVETNILENFDYVL